MNAFAIIPRKDEIEIMPLVMCRDCKWWKTHGATSLRWLPCMDKHTFPDWYCADGVKGEEDAAN